MEKIKALIINRDLFSTVKNTVEFLQKEDRVEPCIIDNASTYPPLLEWYKTNPCNIKYTANNGPYAAWGLNMTGNQYYIIADGDCLYDDVPDDWLDKMMNVLENTHYHKVGFSLNIDNLPDTEFAKHQKDWQKQYWDSETIYGWIADIDTTFALYRPHSQFTYSAIRLDKPYCIKHVAWYLTKENIPEEWKYYLNNCLSVATCKNWLKDII